MIPDPDDLIRCYDADPASLRSMQDVRFWLRWLQHPEGGAMGFDPTLRGRDYVVAATGERTMSDREAAGYDRALRTALRVCRKGGEDINSVSLEEAPE